jgi:hypothetical protein
MSDGWECVCDVLCCADRYGSDEDNLVAFNEEERGYLQGVVGIAMLTPTPDVYAAFQARLAKLTPQIYPVCEWLCVGVCPGAALTLIAPPTPTFSRTKLRL